MFAFILKKIFGTQNERFLKKIQPLVEKINSFEKEASSLSQDEMQNKSKMFKKRLSDERKELKEKMADLLKSLDEIHIEGRTKIEDEIKAIKEKLKVRTEAILEEMLPLAFAMVREAAQRTISLRPYDVQLVGGIVLHRGYIAEMANGEGKTLVATLPAYLNALVGEGVHVVTVNDYLAERDRQWMGPVYEYLGLTVGVVQHDMAPKERQVAYNSDITYGTNNEFGFDYLRDNMALARKDQAQAGRHHYTIVDEVDSILVDEARTPLIISGPAEESTDKYYEANKIIPSLKKGSRDEEAKTESGDFVIDEKAKSSYLTEEGELKASRLLGVEDTLGFQMKYKHLVAQALRAHYNFKRDTDYVVKDKQVIIVDEFTGRLMAGRRWSDGLHQAIEAKEGLKIERENQTLATITLQNYFRMYNKLSGMTGTGWTEAAEFVQIYKLEVIVIPTNKPIQRVDAPDLIYKSQKEKYEAVCEKVEELYKQKRPVLVGTTSIEKNELLSDMLKRKGIPHQVLNAKYHEMEAHIVAQAGHLGAVTMATNMAGRGTDIQLGGNNEYMTEDALRQAKIGPYDTNYKEEYKALLEKFSRRVAEEKEKVIKLGGLYVIGTERHESRRIDNQLRGRAGRQGSSGYSQFYLSLEDDLMRIFGSDRIKGVMEKLGFEEGQVLQHGLITRAIETAQQRVEKYNFEIRKQLLEYDNIMNRQREVIYEERNMVLQSDNLKKHVLTMIQDVLESKIDLHLKVEPPAEPDTGVFRSWLKSVCPIETSDIDFKDIDFEKIESELIRRIKAAYEAKEEALGRNNIRMLEKIITLQSIDSHWKEHLRAMDSLREGIGLRAYGQRNPLVEYQQEAHYFFSQMIDRIKEEVADKIFKVVPMGAVDEQRFGIFSALPLALKHEEKEQFETLPQRKAASAHDINLSKPVSQEERKSRIQTIKRVGKKIGRNDPCPCGSGKKYKKCCGKQPTQS